MESVIMIITINNKVVLTIFMYETFTILPFVLHLSQITSVITFSVEALELFKTVLRKITSDGLTGCQVIAQK